jgi:hypothetical protein
MMFTDTPPAMGPTETVEWGRLPCGLRHRCHRHGEEALHVGGAAPGQPVVAPLLEPERITAPVGRVRRDDVHVRGKEHPSAIGSRLGKQTELRATRVGRDRAAGAPRLEPSTDEPGDLGIGLPGHARKRDQLLQQLARDPLAQWPLWWQCAGWGGGTSSAGLRSKKPTGRR